MMVGVGAEVVIVGTFVGPGEREVDGARSLECFWNLERNAGAIVRPVVDLYVSKCTSHGTAQNPTSPVPLIDLRPSLIRTEFVVCRCMIESCRTLGLSIHNAPSLHVANNVYTHRTPHQQSNFKKGKLMFVPTVGYLIYLNPG